MNRELKIVIKKMDKKLRTLKLKFITTFDINKKHKMKEFDEKFKILNGLITKFIRQNEFEKAFVILELLLNYLIQNKKHFTEEILWENELLKMIEFTNTVLEKNMSTEQILSSLISNFNEDGVIDEKVVG